MSFWKIDSQIQALIDANVPVEILRDAIIESDCPQALKEELIKWPELLFQEEQFVAVKVSGRDGHGIINDYFCLEFVNSLFDLRMVRGRVFERPERDYKWPCFYYLEWTCLRVLNKLPHLSEPDLSLLEDWKQTPGQHVFYR